MLRRTIRIAAVLVALALLWFVGRPVLHVARFHLRDTPVDQVFDPAYGDDVAGLERAAVDETWSVPSDRAAAEEGLRALLARAAERDLPVSIAGARHTMGGHTIAPGGVIVDMRGFDRVEVDAENGRVTAGAGATWAAVLRALSPHGLSVAVMQSNESFTVGGSLGANCHGWQHGRPPISSTVRALRVMLADGRVVRAARDENDELFRHVIGGYGLFGIVLEATLDVVPDERYAPTAELVPVAELGPRLLAAFEDPEVGMAIGRLSVAPDSFLTEGLLKTLTRVPGAPDARIAPTGKRGLRRAIFRGSVGSDYGKELRWSLERHLGPLLLADVTTRNSELAEPVDWFRGHDPGGTDVLVELFVPHDRLAAFVERARPLLGDSEADLLNVTVRDVRRDDDTALAYARTDVFGLVMLFHQPRTEAGEAAQRDVTRALIEASLAEGGTYYLPYRSHATREQFTRAYPAAASFFDAKERWDPENRFRNQWFAAYGPVD